MKTFGNDFTITKSLKWWFCWPWFKSKKCPRNVYDVGISVARAILVDGNDLTITREGRVTNSYYEWYYTSESALKEAMADKWVLADNNVYYNRQYIMSYTVKHKSYLVYDDNTEMGTEWLPEENKCLIG